MQKGLVLRKPNAVSQARDSALVVVCVVAAALARLPLIPYLDNHDPFITFFPAIVAAAWIAGWGGGLLAVALSSLAVITPVIAARRGLDVTTPEDIVSLATFVAVGLGISAISQAQRRAKFQAESALAREALLNRLNGAIRQSLDVHAVHQTAVDILGPSLEADRCVSILIDEAGDRARFVNEWRRPGLPPVVGERRLSGFDADLPGLFPEGRTHVVEDVETAVLSPSSIAIVRKLGVRAYIHVPLLENGRVTGILGAYDMSGARRWSATEIALLESAAAQMRAVAETARLVAQAQAQAQREALVSQIGQALLATLDPEVIQWRAARQLGEALGADRCFFVTYDFAADYLCAGEDWHRPDLPSVMGEYSASTYRFVLNELFAHGTGIVPDARAFFSPAAAAVQESFGQRATLAVPLYDRGELVAALFAAMADAPRAWTADEVALIEEVAVLTRTALASAHLSQREQRIAAQLQAALQPVIPARMPGLRLAYHYRPALKEAEVGGDFADCFSVAAGQTMLIVGDLSGKGLEAATQVATVRNMLRYALYNGRTVSGPMTRLNHTLASNHLLLGFATLFVGRFDAESRTLHAVNCGQDPALVMRAATGAVELLEPTGAVLGAFPELDYDEVSLSLSPGDILAVFTDGLTEAGPNRAEMLGMKGMTRLLQERLGEKDPSVIVTRMIEGVNAHARDGVRDDVCLLVGVVDGETMNASE